MHVDFFTQPISSLIPPPSSFRGVCRRRVMINYLYDVREVNFDYLAVGAFHLDAGFGERLRGLHAAHYAAHARAVACDYLYVVFAVKRLQCCECFGYFHQVFTTLSSRDSLNALYERES